MHFLCVSVCVHASGLCSFLASYGGKVFDLLPKGRHRVIHVAIDNDALWGVLRGVNPEVRQHMQIADTCGLQRRVNAKCKIRWQIIARPSIVVPRLIHAFFF